ncbi:hypothetical protein, partial [Halorubrum trueperi]
DHSENHAVTHTETPRWRASERPLISGREEPARSPDYVRLPENLRFSLDAVSTRRARIARLGRYEVLCSCGRLGL